MENWMNHPAMKNHRSAQAGTDQDSRETDERKIWK